ncbi:prostatic acid phosphatase-like, partial [Python bivittatus]|uniref:acid phosphatase n=1 Tax=Python bivittatus TaxID=176946 RepID=A0A9F2WKM3_PYTBI
TFPQPTDEPVVPMEEMQSPTATAEQEIPEIMTLEFPETAIPEHQTLAKPVQQHKKHTWHQLLGRIFRHGDRSPVSTFPTNTVNEDVWPQGYGQLTKIGIQQQYELGKYLKARYKNFLSPSYKQKEIYVRSTDYDRTIMSAQANLAGLFPPSASEAWNRDIHWQPIPVHTVPLSEEKLLMYPNFHCPHFNELLQRVKGEATFRKTLKQYM